DARRRHVDLRLTGGPLTGGRGGGRLPAGGKEAADVGRRLQRIGCSDPAGPRAARATRHAAPVPNLNTTREACDVRTDCVLRGWRTRDDGGRPEGARGEVPAGDEEAAGLRGPSAACGSRESEGREHHPVRQRGGL